MYKHNLVSTFPNISYDPNIWFVMTSALGNVSNDLLANNYSNMEYNIMILLYIIIKLSYIFNVDLDQQWNQWKKKACKKKYNRGIYDSSSYSSNIS